MPSKDAAQVGVEDERPVSNQLRDDQGARAARARPAVASRATLGPARGRAAPLPTDGTGRLPWLRKNRDCRWSAVRQGTHQRP